MPTKEINLEPETIIEKRPFFQKSSSEAPESKSVRTLTFENSNLSGRSSLERDVPPRRGKTAPFGNHYSERVARKPALRGSRGSGRGDHRRGRGGSRHISPRFLENKVSNLSTEMHHLTIEDSTDVTGSGVQSDAVRQLDNNGKNRVLFIFSLHNNVSNRNSIDSHGLDQMAFITFLYCSVLNSAFSCAGCYPSYVSYMQT